MKYTSYTQARNKLAPLMEEVCRDRDAVVIQRAGHDPVVMMALEEFEAWKETLHLFSTPANAERIRRGLEDFKQGRFKEAPLCD